ELAYRRRGEALGSFGVARLSLPEFDVDAIGVTWHLYAPDDLVPVEFDANLTQESSRRYGTFRRLEQFLDEAFGGRKAWAGEDNYKSILAQRRTIYDEEAVEKGGGDVSPKSFPLVGQRYRFKRILLDREQPRIALVYLSRPAAAAIRWGAFALAFLLAFVLLAPGRRTWRWVLAAAGAAGLLIVAHYVMGVHRRLVWGVDLALVVTLIRLRRARGLLGWRELLWS